MVLKVILHEWLEPPAWLCLSIKNLGHLVLLGDVLSCIYNKWQLYQHHFRMHPFPVLPFIFNAEVVWCLHTFIF